MNILEIKDLKKSFKDVNAVNGISMYAEKGEILGILGPNGAGKSTTIGCILGIIAPDSGTVTYDGNNSLKKWKQNIGYVPQDLAIYETLTAEENVRFFCSLYGGKDIDKKVEYALDFVGLSDVKDKRAETFSGGMKRRLNLACGISHEPKLIIMDEPTVGIDPQSRNRIIENVKKLNARGATIIYTTHYMPEAEELCDRLVVVDHGKVISSGTKQEILERISPKIIATVTFAEESDNAIAFADELKNTANVEVISSDRKEIKVKYDAKSNIMNEIINLTVKHQLSIGNISSEEPSLEDIFLSLTGKDLRDSI